MQSNQRRTMVRLTGCWAICAAALIANAQQPDAKTAAVAKPAMTVTVAQPQNQQLSQRLSANGTVAAWQEASVGAEIGGLRLTEVRVNVGDQVKAGQVLAVFTNDTVLAELSSQFAEAILPVRIGVTTSLAKAQSVGLDIFSHDKNSRGAKSYRELAALLFERLHPASRNA